MAISDGEHVRHLFPPTDDQARAALLEFARSAPLVYGPWRHFKWLYKQAEATTDADLLGPLIGRLDSLELPSAPDPTQPRAPGRF